MIPKQAVRYFIYFEDSESIREWYGIEKKLAKKSSSGKTKKECLIEAVCGNMDKARKLAETFKNRDSYPAVLSKLAYIGFVRSNYEEAEELSSKTLHYAAGNRMALAIKSCIAAKNGNLKRAQKLYKNLRKKRKKRNTIKDMLKGFSFAEKFSEKNERKNELLNCVRGCYYIRMAENLHKKNKKKALGYLKKARNLKINPGKYFFEGLPVKHPLEIRIEALLKHLRLFRETLSDKKLLELSNRLFDETLKLNDTTNYKKVLPEIIEIYKRLGRKKDARELEKLMKKVNSRSKK